MKILFTLLSIGLWATNCNPFAGSTNDGNNPIRLANLLNQNEKKQADPKLKITGNLKDTNSQSLANAVLSMSSRSISTNLNTRQSASKKSLRFVDYSLLPNKLKGTILQDFDDDASVYRYELFWKETSQDKQIKLVKLDNIYKTTSRFQYFLNEIDKPDKADEFLVMKYDTADLIVQVLSTRISDTIDGAVTDENGNFAISCEHSKLYTIQVLNKLNDIGDLTVDLSSAKSGGDLSKIENEAKSNGTSSFIEKYIKTNNLNIEVKELTYNGTIGNSTTSTYTIGGTITGLTAAGLVLQNNAVDDLTIAANTTNFSFVTKITGAYTVTIKTQPTGQTCSIANASGTAATDITNVNVTCTTNTYTIGGTITGLTGSVVLQNNNSNNLSLSANSSFNFTTPIAYGSTYSVTVLTNPSNQVCIVTNGSGTTTANVTNVSVSCFPGITRPWGTFADLGNATIRFDGIAGTFGGNTYTAKTLYFMKCSQGQTWNPTNNDCTGTGTATDYGAGLYLYCSVDDESCNDATTKLLNGTGTSQAYTSCNSLNTNPTGGFAGKTGWRVPTKDELKLLIQCTDPTEMPNDSGSSCTSYTQPTINNIFPNTIPMSYWSSNTYTTNTTSAIYVSFSSGYLNNTPKSLSGRNIRCVSGP